MSHAIARESPAPAAGPRTIAIVGFGISCSQRDVSIAARSAWAFSSMVWPPSSLPSAIALTSPPAQEAAPGAGQDHAAYRWVLGENVAEPPAGCCASGADTALKKFF